MVGRLGAVVLALALLALAVPAGASDGFRAGRTTFVWRERFPMAPYLATSTLGRFDLTRFRPRNGLPVYIAVDPTLPAMPVLKKLADIVAFYSSIYGRYPFDAVGAIVDDVKEVGFRELYATPASDTEFWAPLPGPWIGPHTCSTGRSTTGAA